MRQHCTTVYEYDELSDQAKAKARDWYRDGMGNEDFADYTIEDAKRMAELLGITIDTRPVRLMGGGTRQAPCIYWELDVQGAGACFEGRYQYETGGAAKIAAEAPAGEGEGYAANNELNRIAGELAKCPGVSAVIRATNRGCASHDTVIEFEDFSPFPGAHEVVAEALRDFMDWIHSNLEAEYEYQTSDEQVAENIRGNEYAFTEDGARSVVVR